MAFNCDADFGRFIRQVIIAVKNIFCFKRHLLHLLIVLNTSNTLSDKFDQLQLHARDFDSMLWHFRPNNDFSRFETEVTNSMVELRNFKATAEELIQQCAVLSLIPPLLADHVRREAEHFLEILNLIQEEISDCHQPKIICCDSEYRKK